MTRNPMAGLVQALAAPVAVGKDPGLRVSDAIVLTVDPVTVRQVGADPDSDPLAPLPLVATGSLAVGARVLILHRGTQAILLGRTAGGSADRTGWETLDLAAPWGQYQTASSWGSPVVCVRDGVVRLRGMVTGGTTGTSAEPLAVLPSWARPARTRIGLAVANDQPAPFQVGPDGALHLRGPFTAGWVSLSSISFPL